MSITFADIEEQVRKKADEDFHADVKWLARDYGRAYHRYLPEDPFDAYGHADVWSHIKELDRGDLFYRVVPADDEDGSNDDLILAYRQAWQEAYAAHTTPPDAE